MRACCGAADAAEAQLANDLPRSDQAIDDDDGPSVDPGSGALPLALVAAAPFCFAAGTIILVGAGPSFLTVVGACCCLLATAASSLLAYVVFTSRASVGPVEPWAHAGDLTSKFDWDGSRPLRVLFMTWGSRGDHEPNVALGLELARRGHEVTVMGYGTHRAMIEAHAPALKYREVRDDNMPRVAAALNEEGADFLGIAGAFARDNLRSLAGQYARAAEETGADVLVGQCVPLCSLAHYTAAQMARKPLFLLSHDPINGHNSAAWSYNPGPNRCADHGWLANVVNSRVMGVVLGLTAFASPSSPARRFRAEQGLRTPWPLFEVLYPKTIASIPVICTFDRTLWPRPTDFSEHWVLTGWLDKAADAADPSGVKTWVASRQSYGRPVWYAGLGSFDHHDRAAMSAVLVATAQRVGADLVTLRSTVSDDLAASPPPFVLVAEEVPHAWLFPRCAVVIHHGGAGTSSQVIRSGRPGVCVPAMRFQSVWGARIADHGAGVLLEQDDLLRAWANGDNLLYEAVGKALAEDVQAAAHRLADQSAVAPGTRKAAGVILQYARDLAAQQRAAGAQGGAESV